MPGIKRGDGDNSANVLLVIFAIVIYSTAKPLSNINPFVEAAGCSAPDALGY